MRLRLSSMTFGILSLIVLAACGPKEEPPPYTQYRVVTTGASHTCGLTSADDALCWGDNASGQLGDGTTTSSSKPVLVAGNLKFSTIAAGSSHTCAVSQGEVYCWGMNLNGEVGNGAAPNGPAVLTPTKISGPPNTAYGEVAAGASFTCALTKLGQAQCWGQTAMGKLGLGPNQAIGRMGDPALPNESITVPTPIAGSYRFKSIVARGQNVCALTTSNQVYCWGSNLFWQLGVSTIEGCQVGSNPAWPCSKSAQLVQQPLPKNTPTGVAVGDDFACYTSDTYDLYCWGSNAHGQIAPKASNALQVCKFLNGMSFQCSPSPRKLARPTAGTSTLGFVRVAAGADVICSSVYPVGNAVVCWGRNNHGQLGDGQTTDRETAAGITGGHGALDISAGNSHVCLVTDGANAHRIYCWGANTSGQLGNGATSPHEATPQLVVER
jgi:alpha-tubulin suppressor-like RCC1 family protein